MRSGRPSGTARVVATGVLLIHHDPDLGHLVPKDAAQAILRLLGARSPVRAAVLARGLRRAWFRRALRAVERLGMPGIMLHHAVRKRYIEDETRRALAEGARQVVVLGAGLDTLALRLHREFPRTLFVEVDHPATQEAKRRAFSDPKARPADNLRLLPADFTRQSADEVIAGCPGYDAGARGVLIMEGVLMYLTPEDVDRAFASVLRCGGPGSRFIFTFMEPGSDGRPGFRRRGKWSDAWLAWKGEPFLSGLRPGALPGFLAERGFRPRDLPSADDLRRRYLPAAGDGIDLAEGERICVAEKA